ncbi:MAG: NAD(P)H-binding protein [Bacteroidetes bacterium]|nr:NAD(P)H-binding protein [Bacteroidota bacterium]
MNIVLTGSLGHISRPLTQMLAKAGHTLTVISSQPSRQREIESLGALPAIGSINDVDFLTRTFTGAEIVYLMEPPISPAQMFDPALDPYQYVNDIVKGYKEAVQRSGVKKIVHLSSIGAHTDTGVGLLKFHYHAEHMLKQLPADVSIKFMRPVGFYYNLLLNIDVIKMLSKGFVGGLMALQHYGISGLIGGQRGVVASNYGGDTMNLLVSPYDIATVIAEEMGKPFAGRSFRYIASEELTCNEVAAILGPAIGKPYLKWVAISDKMLTNTMLKQGANEKLTKGVVEMGAAGRTGVLYEDYYKHRPVLGPTKLKSFLPEFAAAYNK